MSQHDESIIAECRRPRLEAGGRSAIFGGSASFDEHSDPRIVDPQISRFCRTWLFSGCRLHGSGQLGYRPSGRLHVRLYAALGYFIIKPDRDWAQACRDHFSKPVVIGLWLLAELAIAACDLAEVIGSAIALHLMFGIPIIYGVIITVVDVFIVLLLQNKGFRYIENLVVLLIATIGGCFLVELRLSKPDMGGIARGFIPTSELRGRHRTAGPKPIVTRNGRNNSPSTNRLCRLIRGANG